MMHLYICAYTKNTLLLICWLCKVKQEQWIPSDVMLSFSPRTRNLLGNLSDTPQSRQLVTSLMQVAHGVHGHYATAACALFCMLTIYNLSKLLRCVHVPACFCLPAAFPVWLCLPYLARCWTGTDEQGVRQGPWGP